MKHVVYTAVFGDYDTVQPIAFDSACDFLCFTDDKNLHAPGWQLVLPNVGSEPAHLSNRRFKILPHRYLPDHEMSLYVDGNIDIVRDPAPLFEKYAGSNFCAMEHFERSCVYEEANALLASKRLSESDKRRLKDQVHRYSSEGFPASFGLTENNVMMRRNAAAVEDLMELWWREFVAGAPRDQLCLSYALWKRQVDVRYMDEKPRERQDYFAIRLHKRESQMGLMRRIRYLSAIRKYQNPGYRLIATLYELADSAVKVFR